jgi:integrase
MAVRTQKRKDPKGRVLKDGESYRQTDGRYVYRWTNKWGKTHSIYAKDLDMLRQKEDVVTRDLCDGIKVGSEANITVNDVYETWKKDKVGLKATTRTNYLYMYEHFVKEDLGKVQVKKVKKSDIRRFYNKLIDSDGMAINTLETIHNVLHQVFKLAVEDEYMRNNPCSDVLGDVKRSHNYQTPKRHALTIPEQEAFVKYLSETPKYRHWLPLFTFFLGTGCRVSEVVGLRWDDVHMDESYIDINHNLVYYAKEKEIGAEKRKCYHSISTPKTEAGTRIIPMLPEVKDALVAEKEYQRECGITCRMIVDGYTDFVFLNRFGDVHNPQTINRTIKRVVLSYNEEEVEKASKERREPVLIPPFSCHNLRHTFATRYCENETNLKVIQEILGHKDISTTMDVYAEATKDVKVKSFGNLSGKIKIS